MKLDYTKQQVEEFKQKLYFTNNEIKILEMWLYEYSNVQMALKMNMSTATISRIKKNILDKIKRVS